MSRRPLFISALSMALASSASGQAALDAAERKTVIDRIAAELDSKYVFPDTARAMISAMRARQARGEYDRIVAPAEFADSLTAHLRAVSRDKHLRVVLRGGTPAGGSSAQQQTPAAPRAPDGLEEATTLTGNIGYLRFSGFADASRVGDRITAAMTQLHSTDALIIDVRDNGGGSPTSVMHLAGHLFPERLLVARIYSRPDNTTTEMWTADVTTAKYLDKPVYVLTNRRTFSAAEAAAYHLQAFGRARVVGDTTGGGAHRVQGAALNDRFAMSVPFTRPTNVRTNTDWEGKGVIPDIAVNAAEALTTAQLAALRALPRTPERERAMSEISSAAKR